MAAVGEAEEVKSLYVGNLHPYVNEAMLQVCSPLRLNSAPSLCSSSILLCHAYGAIAVVYSSSTAWDFGHPEIQTCAGYLLHPGHCDGGAHP